MTTTEAAQNLNEIINTLAEWITDSSVYESVINRFKELAEIQDRPEYTDLTLFIYGNENDQDEEKIDLLEMNIQKVIEKLKEQQDNNTVKFVEKVIDHIKLAKAQKEYINKKLSLAVERLNEISAQAVQAINLANKATEIAKTAETQLKEVEKGKSKIYAEFVAILGIFTAVVLGAFGSLQVIGSVFNHIKDVPTGKLLVFSSLTSMGVILLLFILMRWINRIVHIDGGKRKHWRLVAKENSIFLIGLFCLLYMFFLGFLLYTPQPKNNVYALLSKVNWGMWSLGIISVLLIASVLLILINTYIIKSPPEEE